MNEFYKDIIIIGRIQCIRNTLANKITEVLPYQIIHVDALKESFFNTFPELAKCNNYGVINKKFQKFLNHYLKIMKKKTKRKCGYILEGTEISFKNILNQFKNKKCLIYGLGIIETKESTFLKQKKEIVSDYDLTYQLSNQELKKNKKIQQFCENNNIPFYNTVYNRIEILDKIVENIKENYKYKIKKPENITNTDWLIIQEKFADEIEKILIKLEKNYPIQYLIGDVDFLDCKIKVNRNVLIPRFETELLVEKTIKKLKDKKINNPNIIDLGTGSGCIAIAIKKRMKCNMTAIDNSIKALKIAKENANFNKTKINFIKKNILNISLADYDVVISNPPYVKETEPVGEETKYEPQKALFAKEEGTYYYRIIMEKIKKQKRKPKIVIFEIGMTQKSIIKDLAKKNLPEYSILIEKDYNNRERFVFLEQ